MLEIDPYRMALLARLADDKFPSFIFPENFGDIPLIRKIDFGMMRRYGN